MKYATGCEKEGGDGENGPKQCRTRRLGHTGKFFIYLSYNIGTN